MPLSLYSLPDGPPSIAIRQCLKYLGVDYTVKNVDYQNGEHTTEDFAKKNPQKEMPVLDDDGFYLGESNAILQYLADKYAKDETLYPKNLKERAIVNHRLCFNLSTYYRHICDHALVPMFFDYKRTTETLKKTHIALQNFNTYLKLSGTKYAASDYVTIADFQLVTATMSLEAIEFDISDYPLVQKWYATYKKEYPDLWEIVDEARKDLNTSEKNPPDLSHMNHPLYHIRRNK